MTEAARLEIVIEGKDTSASALLDKIEARMKGLDRSSTQAGQALGTNIGQGAQRAADGTVRLEQARARLARATGDTAGAERILTTALTNAGDASERVRIGLETQIAQLQRGSTFAQEFGGSLKSSLLGIIGPAALAGTLIQAIGAGVDLAKLGAGTEAARQSFDNLARSAGLASTELLNQMRAASGGTIADAKLIQSANTGILLAGEKLAARLPQLIEIARASALATGQDIGFIFDSLVRGIARGSPQIIDNAGITLDAAGAFETYAASIGKSADQLTNQEQQQATLNAVLQAGGQIVATVGASNDSAAASYARLSAAIENVKTKFGEFLANATAEPADRIATGLERILRGTEGLNEALIAADAEVAGKTAGWEAYNAAIAAGASIEQARAAEMRAAAQASAEYAAWQLNAAAATDVNSGASLQYISISETAANMEDRRAGTLSTQAQQELAAAQAADVQSQALFEQAKQSLEASTQSEQLARFQADLANLGGQVANGHITAANAAGQLASAYNLASNEAAQLIQLQAQLAQARVNTQALADQRAGERNPGASGAAEALAQEEARLQTIYRKLANPPKIPRASGGGGVGAGRARGGGGGGGTTVGGVKLSDQQKLNNQLLTDEEKFNDKYEAEDLQHAKNLLKIQNDFAKKLIAAQRDLQTTNLDSRASFYDSLASIDDAGLRSSLAAEYEQAFAEAQQVAAEKGADVGKAYLEARQQALQAQAQRQSAIAEAEKSGDKGKADYLRGVDELYRKSEQARIDAAKAGDDSIKAQQEQALSDEALRHEEAYGTIADSAETSADRRIAAAQRAGKAIEAERLQVDSLGAAYNRIGAGSGTTGTTGGTSGEAAPAPATDVLGALEAVRAAVDAAAAAIVRAEQDTGRAVRSLSSSGGVAA